MIGASKMYPEWVTKHKRKGTNISCIGGKYYLYAVTSVWNKEKGRAQMVNKGYLGRITQEGFIPKHEKKPMPETNISIKEYGATKTLYDMSGDILGRLREIFGTDGETIYTMALLRFLRNCPFKRVELSYQNSYISELLPGLKLSSKELTAFLRRFGEYREKTAGFMAGLIGEGAHVIFDGMSLTSNSEKMDINKAGYNSRKEFDPQIGLMYAFSQDQSVPAYYRIVPGNIRDVTAFRLCLQESGIKNGVIIADKGFASDDNFKMLDQSGLQYIVPVKRNSTLFDPGPLKSAGKSAFEGYFLHEKRPVWYYTSTNGVVVFLDSDLKADEEKSYLRNIENNTDGYTIIGFHEKQHAFGIIALKTNLSAPPSETYAYYKQRMEIEQSFDFLKNLLEQDKSFMQNEKSLETWAFINHISLILCYKVYNLLRDKKLISKYSISDFLDHLKYISKAKINGDWFISESTKRTKTLLMDIGLPIT